MEYKLFWSYKVIKDKPVIAIFGSIEIAVTSIVSFVPMVAKIEKSVI